MRAMDSLCFQGITSFQLEFSERNRPASQQSNEYCLASLWESTKREVGAKGLEPLTSSV